jgi:transcriptional regulator with GAF, ATPase, and Fis domain
MTALGLVFSPSAAGDARSRSVEDLPPHGCARERVAKHRDVSDLPATISSGSRPGRRPTWPRRIPLGPQRSQRGAEPGHAPWHSSPGRWTPAPADRPAAQHVAAYVSLAVAHEQLAAAEGCRAEARGRSERVDVRVRALADKGEPLPSHGRMIGRSDAWQRVLTRALRVAPTDTTVFLQGDSGTGKEIVARFIHQASPRKDGPFVAINCAALPEQLLESELFGYERGAFTGAHQAKAGQIELASRGVLFLDEVSEMSLVAQAKFLRFLQEREFQRLGGTRTQKANVRVIAASNRDLRQAVEKGTFREDLFYRLQVFDIPLPALRERLSDVPLLAEQFLSEVGEAMGGRAICLADEARDALLAHSWPGNVRDCAMLERAAFGATRASSSTHRCRKRKRSAASPTWDH